MLTAHGPAQPQSTASPRRRPLPSAPMPAVSPVFAPSVVKEATPSPIAKTASPEPTQEEDTTRPQEATSKIEVEQLRIALAKAERRAKWVPKLQQQVNDLLGILATMEATLKVHFPDWQTKTIPSETACPAPEQETEAVASNRPIDGEAADADVSVIDDAIEIKGDDGAVEMKGDDEVVETTQENVEASSDKDAMETGPSGDPVHVVPDNAPSDQPIAASDKAIETDRHSSPKTASEQGEGAVQDEQRGGEENGSQWAMKRSFSADSIASLATSLVHDAEKTIVENGLHFDATWSLSPCF